ncbi:MAG: hypothetical protein HP477_01855 [Nitrospira sp.]|nr:hypothetical protein [Nitrospira sp.]
MHDEVKELVEGFEGFGRVRRPGQRMGELLNEHSRQAQLLLVGWIGQLLSVAITDVEAVVQLGLFDVDLRFGNIDIAHGERVGEGIEKGGGIVRPDVHNRVSRRLAIIEGDLDRVEQAAEGSTAPTELLDQPAIHRMAGFFELMCVEQADHRAQFLRKPVLFSCSKRGAVNRLDAEDVDDLLTTQPGPPLWTPARTFTVGGFSRFGRCGFGKRIDLTFFDVQSKGGEEAANGGKLGKIVIGDDGHIGTVVLLFGDREFAEMVRRQSCCQMDMLCDGGWIDSSEIFLIHPTDKVVQNVGRDVLAVRCDGPENLFTVVHCAGSIPQCRSLCERERASIMPRQRV